jgi:hypothetical protein
MPKGVAVRGYARPVMASARVQLVSPGTSESFLPPIYERVAVETPGGSREALRGGRPARLPIQSGGVEPVGICNVPSSKMTVGLQRTHSIERTRHSDLGELLDGRHARIAACLVDLARSILTRKPRPGRGNVRRCTPTSAPVRAQPFRIFSVYYARMRNGWVLIHCISWRPLPDSNRCCRRESGVKRTRGDGLGQKKSYKYQKISRFSSFVCPPLSSYIFLGNLWEIFGKSLGNL